VEIERTDSVANIVGSVGRGYYAIEALAPAHVDLSRDTFEIRICGFALRKGSAATPVADARLCGTISGFLHGIQAAGEDLDFAHRHGAIGSPTLLVVGPELKG
jgi:predicted Zn-dependent protease